MLAPPVQSCIAYRPAVGVYLYVLQYPWAVCITLMDGTVTSTTLVLLTLDLVVRVRIQYMLPGVSGVCRSMSATARGMTTTPD